MTDPSDFVSVDELARAICCPRRAARERCASGDSGTCSIEACPEFTAGAIAVKALIRERLAKVWA